MSEQMTIDQIKTDNSQCGRLLRHFKNGGKVTSMSAYMLFGITQLGARIKDLETKGHRFARPRITLPASGKSVCQYSIHDKLEDKG